MAQLSIASDFDGTISHEDSLKLLFDRFADSSWRDLEKAVKRGQIPEREALQQMLQRSAFDFEDALNFILDQVKVDPQFIDFSSFCEDKSIPLIILSGGFIEFIQPLLRQQGITRVPVFANSLGKDEAGKWKVIPRQLGRECLTQNHCKCASFEKFCSKSSSEFRVFIGDGHTDLCVAQKANFVFAKSFLKESRKANAQVFFDWENFGDILSFFKKGSESLEKTPVSLFLSELPRFEGPRGYQSH